MYQYKSTSNNSNLASKTL